MDEVAVDFRPFLFPSRMVMSGDPLWYLRPGFSVDVSSTGVHVSGLAPETVSFGSIEITQPGESASAVPSQAAAVPQPPPTPAGFWDMASSFTTSVAKFAAGGFRTVTEEDHRLRLAQCDGCEHHTGTRCNLCGCFTQAKGWMPHEDCPIGKWPKQTAE